MPRKKQPKSKSPPNEGTPFQKFEQLAKKLVSVSKDEVNRRKSSSD